MAATPNKIKPISNPGKGKNSSNGGMKPAKNMKENEQVRKWVKKEMGS